MPVRALGGAHLNVIGQGQGRPIVALHGFTGSASTWSFLASALGDRYRVIAVDLPGHGDSDSPADPALYTMERTVQALAEVLDRLGVERTCWLGYSLGGRVALGAAIALPERTAGVILESVSPGLATPEERAARVQEDERLADWLLTAGIERFVDYWEAIPLWASQARLSAEARASLREQRLRNSALGLANSLRGIGQGAQPFLGGRLGEIKAPVLSIAGEEDARYTALARELHGALPGSRLQVIRAAGHAAHLEQPSAFLRAVESFLSEVGEGTPAQVSAPPAARQRRP
ncbi:MAG: 2-succinyl-6-hydroxy-2,4-cyclohexadiene-1-carboxylate synthase [Chloroflexi bacterium]|nr:2-succinyl-6-hydroxy-2,4-cyclohexadiene-1-carboxylate synthase [Chloroflexota bacterium]